MIAQVTNKRVAASLDTDSDKDDDADSDEEVIPVGKKLKTTGPGNKCDCSDPATGKIKNIVCFKHNTTASYFDPKYQKKYPNYHKVCCNTECRCQLTSNKALHKSDPDKYRLISTRSGVYICHRAETSADQFCMAAYCEGDCYKEDVGNGVRDAGTMVPKRQTRGGSR